MELPLLTPAASSFIKNFPAVHEFNSDLIDDYAGPACLTSHALLEYEPALTAVTTNPVIGTGGDARIRGFSYVIFDQVFSWGEFRFGTSGANFGSGGYRISLPFVVNTAFTEETTPLGTASAWDDSAATTRQPITPLLLNSSQIQFSVRLNSGAAARTVSNTIPFTMAASDGISWAIRYQRIS